MTVDRNREGALTVVELARLRLRPSRLVAAHERPRLLRTGRAAAKLDSLAKVCAAQRRLDREERDAGHLDPHAVQSR